MTKPKTTPPSVPVGYRFHPTDEELVSHYLKNKMNEEEGNDYEINNIIPVIDLYKYEPAELPGVLGTGTEAHGDLEWFFFCKKDYKSKKSSRSNRSTKHGFWKITGKERGIRARRSKAVIGKKRTLPFYKGRGRKFNRTNWVIHECYLPGNDKQAQGEFVICRLKFKSDKKDSCDEGEPGSKAATTCDTQSVDDVNQEAHEIGEPMSLDDCCSTLQSPPSQEPEVVLQANGTNDDYNEMQSSFGDTGSCLVDKNDVSNCDEDDETIYNKFPELIYPPEENLDLLFLPQQPQDYCSSILQSSMDTKLGNVSHPLLPQEYQPSIPQPPMSIKLGNGLDANGGCEYWQSTSKKKILTKEFDIPARHITSNFEKQATEYMISEVYPEDKVNLESQSYEFLLQKSTRQMMCTEFGDALHNIECNELQTLFEESDSYFAKFINTNLADQDYYSSDQTA